MIHSKHPVFAWHVDVAMEWCNSTASEEFDVWEELKQFIINCVESADQTQDSQFEIKVYPLNVHESNYPRKWK